MISPNLKNGYRIFHDNENGKDILWIIGADARGVEITPDGKHAFVGCEFTDGIYVIDIENLTLETVIKIGNGPDPMVIWYPPVK